MGFNLNAAANLIFTNHLTYLAPAVVPLLGMRVLGEASMITRTLRFMGVTTHELLHLGVGIITFASPTSFSVIPRRDEGRIVLGSVGFKRLRWYNALFTALAPLSVVPLLLLLSGTRTVSGVGAIQWQDLAFWILAGPCLLHCWPSKADWKLTLISWPLIALSILAAIVAAWAQDWSVLDAWSKVAS